MYNWRINWDQVHISIFLETNQRKKMINFFFSINRNVFYAKNSELITADVAAAIPINVSTYVTTSKRVLKMLSKSITIMIMIMIILLSNTCLLDVLYKTEKRANRWTKNSKLCAYFIRKKKMNRIPSKLIFTIYFFFPMERWPRVWNVKRSENAYAVG